MSRFDDELRATLRAHARHVGPPADPVGWARARARRIRRHRTAAAATVTGVGVVVAAVAVPVLVRHLATDQHPAVVARPAATSLSSGSAAAAAPQAGTRTTPASPLSTLPPPPPDAPDNVLHWRHRGLPPPVTFTRGVDQWLATHAGKDRSRRHVRVLWSGPMPGGRWGQLTQVWNPSDPRYADTWSTVLLIGRPDGTGIDDPYDAPTRFMHQRPGQSVTATRTDVHRIAGYAFGFDGYVLVVGEPKAERALLSVDGQHVTDTKPLSHGAAVLRYRGGPTRTTLVQLRDGRGNVLTHADALAARTHGSFEGWHPDTPPR